MADDKTIKEIPLEPTPTPTLAPAKLEPKKTEKKQEIKPVYPKYQGYSCPICGSKRVTDSSGNYICPVSPKPSDCPVQ